MSRFAVPSPLGLPTLLPLLLLAALAAPARGGGGPVLVPAAADGTPTRLLVAGRSLALPATLAPLRLDPTPLADHDQGLAGLAWLDGAGRGSLAVRWAPWGADGWGAVETVAAPGPGSQLALTATVLDDGTPLLAWSRFDGEDDEIYWSRRDAAGWSPPARLAGDNAVPDVTPALAAVPGGALAAWSRYERANGQYRLLVSRFDGTAWGPPRAVAGPGSLYPTFEGATGVRPLLLYRTAAPRGWAVLELDAEARPVRRAAVVTAGAEMAAERRPKVEDGALRWAGARRELVWEELR